MVDWIISTWRNRKVKRKMTVWRKARRKPNQLYVDFREVDGPQETIKTLEGELVADRKEDYIIRGAENELYPIKKRVFHKIYDECNGVYREI